MTPPVTCIYIALPNSHHYEWALRAVKAEKHALLEKSSASNATKARKLFESAIFTAPDALVLLEAFHYSFHPAWQTFLKLIHQDPLSWPVKTAYSQFLLHNEYFNKSDPHEIRLVFIDWMLWDGPCQLQCFPHPTDVGSLASKCPEGKF
jgi:predicted dehydrogenase